MIVGYMGKKWFTLLLVLALLLPLPALQGQNVDRLKEKLEKYRADNWPPPRSYARTSLGYALQKIFLQHTDYCGFAPADKDRDFVPEDITKFLGRRTLRTKVESANIRGGGLLYYIFNEQEARASFEDINYSPTRIMRMNTVENQFAVNPDEVFDNFILTKTCSGYLKAALDAGIEPPYAAFNAALEKDNRRESMVVALSGKFLSPIKLILDANDSRTTELLMKLWNFYEENPEYVGRAYYLREFEGVMIKHVTSAEENRKIELGGGVDLNGPLPAHLKSSFLIGNTSGTTFSASDWETIIFSDYQNSYQKLSLFAPLPGPEYIQQYFESVRPVFQRARDFPLLTEGVEHHHYLLVEGIPENMAYNFWEIESVTPGVYEEPPRIHAEYFYNEKEASYGCRFTISGKPMRTHFQGPNASRPSKVDLGYTIRSKSKIGGTALRINVQQELQTSTHPTAFISQGQFDLAKQEDRRFAFQWRFAVEVEDRENPVDFDVRPIVDNLIVRRSDQTLKMRLVNVEPEPDRRRFWVTVQTEETFPLDKIDDVNMLSYNLSLDIHLKNKRSGLASVRPLKDILSFPSIKKDPPPEPMTVEAGSDPRAIPNNNGPRPPAPGPDRGNGQ